MGLVDLGVLVVSARVGTSPEAIPYSFVFDEVVRLAKRGVEVHVVRLDPEKSGGYCLSYGVHFHSIKPKMNLKVMDALIYSLMRNLPLGVFRNLSNMYLESYYAMHAAELLRALDLVHAHFAYPEGLVGYLAAVKVGKPLIITVHGYDILTEPSIGYGVRLSKRYDFLVRKVLNAADAVICNSRALYREVRRIMKSKDKVHLIFNGVDLERFNPNIDPLEARRRLGLPLDCFLVFTVRPHAPKYGIEYMIRAVPYVVSRREDVLFVVGGEGPQRRYHEELAKELGVADRIIFTGAIPQALLHLYYAACDVVIVPSLQEAWGLVVTEALASGKPVIGSSVGGIKDQIIDGFNGFLVPPRDSQAIAERILYFIDNPSEARRMGMNGRRLAEESFNIEKRICKIIQLYERVLSERKGG
ncbi:MAG: glycosyltransferase [Desulfurococcaceae archaeon]